MATVTLTKTVSRPTLVSYLGAFTLSATVARPTLYSEANFWNVNQTVSTPTLVANFIVGGGYTLDSVVRRPIAIFAIDSGRLLTATLQTSRPRFYAEIVRQEIGTLAKTVTRPSTSMSMASSAMLDFAYNTRRPSTIFDIVNSTLLGGYTTYTLNTFNAAHTEYTNFDFNSYFKLGSNYYGINSTGVHLLGGDLDVAAEIAAEVDVPVSDFGKQGLKACTDAIVLGRLLGDMELCVVTDEEEERQGHMIPADNRAGLHRIRTKIPKGLKGSVWQFKIKNIDGCWFTINSLEAFIKELQRVR